MKRNEKKTDLQSGWNRLNSSNATCRICIFQIFIFYILYIFIFYIFLYFIYFYILYILYIFYIFFFIFFIIFIFYIFYLSFSFLLPDCGTKGLTNPPGGGGGGGFVTLTDRLTWFLARLEACPRIPKPVTSVAAPAWCLCISLAPDRVKKIKN